MGDLDEDLTVLELRESLSTSLKVEGVIWSVGFSATIQAREVVGRDMLEG